MKRREFLSSTVLSTLGIGALTLAGLSRPANAFAVQSCGDSPTAACRELEQHRQLLTQLNAALTAKGLSDQERRAALAAATCPVCGQPLIG